MVQAEERRDRAPVDITDLRDRIEQAFGEGTFWDSLSMNNKIRHLIERALQDIEAEKK